MNTERVIICACLLLYDKDTKKALNDIFLRKIDVFFSTISAYTEKTKLDTKHLTFQKKNM